MSGQSPQGRNSERIKRRTRRLTYGVALGLLVVVGAVFLAVSLLTQVGRETSLGVPQGPEKPLRPLPQEIVYVARNAALVAFIDVRGVMESEFGRTLASSQHLADARARFLDEAGIDIYSELDSLIVVAFASGTGRPLMLARGRLTSAPLERLVHQGMAVAWEHGGVRIFTHDDISVAYVTPDLALVGPPDSVRNAVDAEAAHNGIATDAEVMRLVASRRHDAAWLVARAASFSGRQTLPSVATPFQSIEWLSASGDVAQTLHGVVQARARSDNVASDLRRTIAGLIILGKLRWRRDPEIGRTLDSLRLSLDGKTIWLTFAVSGQFVEDLMALSRRRVSSGETRGGCPLEKKK